MSRTEHLGGGQREARVTVVEEIVDGRLLPDPPPSSLGWNVPLLTEHEASLVTLLANLGEPARGWPAVTKVLDRLELGWVPGKKPR